MERHPIAHVMTADLARRIVLAALAVGAAYAFTRQCRKPAGWLGRRVARAMNVGHAKLTTWGLRGVRVEPTARVLDVGCGGGRTLRTLAAMASEGRVDGIDYSPASVSVAHGTNADLVASGRVTVQQGTASRLPFADATFDLVTAVETHYYWPDLRADFREVLRVLKPGGRFVIIAEAYKGGAFDWAQRFIMQGVLRSNYLTLDEHRSALVESGFDDVEVDASRRWMRAIATRPQTV